MLLSDITEFIIDTKHNTPKYTDKGYPCIRTPNIGRGYFVLGDVKYVSEETYLKWTERAVPKTGDTILAREAPVGNAAWISPSIRPCIGQRTVLIRPDTRIVCSRYLTYMLLGDECQNRMHAMSGGATVAHLNMSEIRTLEIPDLPPLPTQRKIAAILSAYDDLIENNTRRIQILEESAQLLYREWFVRFRFPGHEHVRMVQSDLGLIPEGWEVKRLEEICDLTMGQSPKSEFYNEDGEGLPFHQGVTDFGGWFPNTRIYCTELNRLAEDGDILFSVRAPVGRINVADKRIVIGRGLSAIRDKSGYQAFMLFQLRERFQEEDSMGGGTIFKAVTKADMQGILLTIPCRELIAEFDRMADSVLQQIRNLTYKNTLLRTTRDLLLPRLISGEVDVTELEIVE